MRKLPPRPTVRDVVATAFPAHADHSAVSARAHLFDHGTLVVACSCGESLHFTEAHAGAMDLKPTALADFLRQRLPPPEESVAA
jgi:hypothetical protein